MVLAIAFVAGCGRDEPVEAPRPPGPRVTIGSDQAVSPVPAWRAPAVEVTDENAAALGERAAVALEEGRLFVAHDAPADIDRTDAAIPLYLALRQQDPDDPQARRGLSEAIRALLRQGAEALEDIDREPEALRRAHGVAAVARVVAPGDRRVDTFLEQLDRADEAARVNWLGENALSAGRIGEAGEADGAIAYFRQALSVRPGDARARQGLAAAESALIRRAEAAAGADDYGTAARWLGEAARVRADGGSIPSTVEDARARIALQRALRVNALRDAGIAELSDPDAPALRRARQQLEHLLRIAQVGDPAVAELRQRIDTATYYGLFRPGQVFTDALISGSRGPQMVVVPHGAFRMGAASQEQDAGEAEYPARNIRFDRGFAMSRTEVTVAEFRRFVEATGHRPRSTRRGYSVIYDERSGNFVRAGNVDWNRDYVGRPAAGDMPVLHVSAGDAARYVDWLSDQTGQRYRLPSEAEFEYVLRAGTRGTYPWPGTAPPTGAGNFTGALDVSPSGRRWTNAFPNYGDGAWGPARVASYRASAWNVHDLAGNVSEWVADCWHSNYRRAPRDSRAWVNPGCRMHVVRGGSWASSPAHTRSAWRQGTDANNTSARVGFRVVRDI